MGLPTPFTDEEIERTRDELLAEGGPFTTMPMTIRGVEYDNVFALSSASLRDFFAFRAFEHGAKDFLVYGDDRYTVQETWHRAMRFAHWLVEERGIKPTDRVAIAMRNYPEWVFAFFGIVATGATVVPMNAWWQTEELEDGLRRAGVTHVVVDDKRAKAIKPFKEKYGITLIGAREKVADADFMMEDVITDEKWPNTPPAAEIDPDSDFCLMYTSGSTGFPKGVLLTQRSAVNAVLSWSFLSTLGQRLRPDYPFMPENPAVLIALPFFHVTALHSTLILSLLLGRKNVLMYRWDAEEAIELIKREEVTNFVGVPTMAHELVDVAKPEDLSTVVDIITGGAKRPSTQVREQKTKLPEVGVSSGYGLTETNALVAHIGMQDYIDRPDSAGRAIPPINEIEVFSEDGKQLPRGSEGEICVKSPVTFRAYLDDEEATAKAFHPGGWFRTGDIGVLDERGFITILDRAKDIILRGGENIACLEVENMLVSHPSVDEACVFAVPDEHYGEIVGAVLYSRTKEIDPQAVRDHVKQHIAAFKVPERIWVSPRELPRGATGKTDKRMIKQVAMTVPATFSA